MRCELTRREMLRLTAAGLLGAGLAPGSLFAVEKTSAEFTFIAVNDLHFSDANCRPWFGQVVAQMKLSAPAAEFCLLGGDLADNGTIEQLTGVRDVFAQLGMPFYSVVGNHDYLAMDNRAAYEKIFPDRINYYFEHRDWNFIGLDTTEGIKSKETVVSETTLGWLDENLPKLDPNKPTIIFTHFPLGEFVYARPLNADAVLEKLARLKAPAIFSGHFHGYTERSFQRTTLTTDRCCSRIRENHDGTKEKGWFVCQAARGEVSRRFVVFEEQTLKG